jgi:hypothetical protein
MMNHDTETTARTLVADGKGILAADETPGTGEHHQRREGADRPGEEVIPCAWPSARIMPASS